MSNIESDKGHPFHEALLVKLEPLPRATELTDLSGWQELVKKEGIKAFPFLLMAKKIEEKIAEQSDEKIPRAPKIFEQQDC